MQTTRHAARILERLKDVHGEPERRAGGDPIGGLVGTILSQNTTDANAARALSSLRQEFPTWSDVLASETPDLVEAIRTGGLAEQKAATIKRALLKIHRQTNSFRSDFLDGFSDERAMHFLTTIKGVGQKTAACVLMFDLDRDVLPVDTHVHRVSTRLGLVPARTSATRTQDVLEEVIAPDDRYPAHVLFIRHGRTICKARAPQCNRCVLNELCDYWQLITHDETE